MNNAIIEPDEVTPKDVLRALKQHEEREGPQLEGIRQSVSDLYKAIWGNGNEGLKAHLARVSGQLSMLVKIMSIIAAVVVGHFIKDLLIN